MAKVKTDASSIWKELENGRNYKAGENLYNIIAQNERFKIGDQWKGINLQNLAPTVYNFIGQVSNTQVSSVMSQQITINRKADEVSADDPMVSAAAKILTKQDSVNWERCKMDALNEDVLMDAFLSGMGGSYWWWDNDIKTGNKTVSIGDFCGETIDSVSLYVSNPNETDVQKQDWNMLSVRLTVQKIKEMAKAYGLNDVDIESIVPDESTTYEAYDKAQNEQDATKSSGDQATLVIKLYKENGKIWCVKSTNSVVIKAPYNTGLTRYPIAIMNWDKRKKFIYGSSPITSVIANQKVANLQAAMRHLHAQLMGIPKVAINKNMVSGFTNTVGGISYVDAQPGVNVSSAIQFIQPTQMTIDVDKSIDDAINRTRDLMGANQAALGESRPDNFSALLAQQKQAGIPLESVRRRFYQYVEDVALIWEDFYKNKYNLLRSVALENEEGEMYEQPFMGTDFKDVYLQTKIDVGASTQWSELVQIDATKDAWDRKIITDPVMYLENMPDNIYPNKSKMIEQLQKEKEMAAQAQMMQPGMPIEPPMI